MNFTREQDELRSAVRAVLTRHEGAAAWGPLTEAVGAAGLGVPEEYGGTAAARWRRTWSWRSWAGHSARSRTWPPPS
ncbi:hypothetical protein [Streptomyces aureus]|uniref:hypothetical protein n=1 Tax=Streptomyces aureus TaxID=193461 RepID=UPI00363D3B91